MAFKGFIQSISVCILLKFYLHWLFMVSYLLLVSNLSHFHTCTLCKMSVALKVIGGVTTSAEVSCLEVNGEKFDSRIQACRTSVIFISPLADPLPQKNKIK